MSHGHQGVLLNGHFEAGFSMRGISALELNFSMPIEKLGRIMALMTLIGGPGERLKPGANLFVLRIFVRI